MVFSNIKILTKQVIFYFSCLLMVNSTEGAEQATKMSKPWAFRVQQEGKPASKIEIVPSESLLALSRLLENQVGFSPATQILEYQLQPMPPVWKKVDVSQTEFTVEACLNDRGFFRIKPRSDDDMDDYIGVKEPQIAPVKKEEEIVSSQPKVMPKRTSSSPSAMINNTPSASSRPSDSKIRKVEKQVVDKFERHIVPSDNSCLFSSVIFALNLKMTPLELRKVVVDQMKANAEHWSMLVEATRDQPLQSYCDWIMKPDSWGGDFELSILSEYFQTQIVGMDISNVRSVMFPDEQTNQYKQRIILFYDGIHYDASKKGAVTQFDTSDDEVMSVAMAIALELNQAKKFTDVQKFQLRCLVCQTGLTGQEAAQRHAKETGHTNFSEY